MLTESTSVTHPAANWRTAPLGGLVASTAVIWSESSANWRQLPARYRAFGTLHAADRPAAGAVLTFHPVNQSLFVYPQALVDDDGRFEIRVPYFGAGAPPGEYAVTIAWRHTGTSLVPAEYVDPAHTPLRATVETRINQFQPWILSNL